MGDYADWEGLAEDMHTGAGGGPDDPASLVAIARAEGVRVERSRHLVGAASQGVFRGQRIVHLRHSLNEIDARFYLAHELFEGRLARSDYRGSDVEQVANFGAAALLCPRRIFLRAIRAGLSIRELSGEFLVTQTLAALRMSEVLGEPRAVVCPHRVYRAGEGLLPEDPTLRSFTRGAMPRGVRRARLTDATKRTLLEFDATG